MCFDTTASNTGSYKGACKLIQDKLGKPLIGLACRHHILELIVFQAIKQTVKKESTGPDNVSFKTFQSTWDSIDKKKFQPCINDPKVAKYFMVDKKDLIEFLSDQMTIIQPRGDYGL